MGAFQLQASIVLDVVLDTVIDVRDLADIVTSVLQSEVLLQLPPALQHQLQGLTVVQLQVCQARTSHQCHVKRQIS